MRGRAGRRDQILADGRSVRPLDPNGWLRCLDDHARLDFNIRLDPGVAVQLKDEDAGEEAEPKIWIDGQDDKQQTHSMASIDWRLQINRQIAIDKHSREHGGPVQIVGACALATSDERTWLREMRGVRVEPAVVVVSDGRQAQETKPKIWIDGQDAKQQDPEHAATCIICEENEPRVALIPCGHMPGCIACTQRILSDAAAAALCPTCRTPVTGVLKVFPN